MNSFSQWYCQLHFTTLKPISYWINTLQVAKTQRYCDIPLRFVMRFHQAKLLIANIKVYVFRKLQTPLYVFSIDQWFCCITNDFQRRLLVNSITQWFCNPIWRHCNRLDFGSISSMVMNPSDIVALLCAMSCGFHRAKLLSLYKGIMYSESCWNTIMSLLHQTSDFAASPMCSEQGK